MEIEPAKIGLPSGKHTKNNQKTIENCPYIVDLPIKVVIFNKVMLVYQRVAQEYGEVQCRDVKLGIDVDRSICVYCMCVCIYIYISQPRSLGEW